MSSKKDSSKRMSFFGPLKSTGILGFGHNDAKQQHDHKRSHSDTTKKRQTILLPDERLHSSDVLRASSNSISDLPLPGAPKTNLSLSPDFARSFSPTRMVDSHFQSSNVVINNNQLQPQPTTEESSHKSPSLAPVRSRTRRPPPPRDPSPDKDELKATPKAEVLKEDISVKDNLNFSKGKEQQPTVNVRDFTMINQLGKAEALLGDQRETGDSNGIDDGANEVTANLKLNTTTAMEGSSGNVSISSAPLNTIISSLESELSEMRGNDVSTTSLGQYSSSFSQQSSVYSPLNFNDRRATSDERKSLDSSIYSSHTENSEQSHTSVLRNEINALLISDDIDRHESQQKGHTESNDDEDITDNEESFKRGHTRAAPSDATVKVFEAPNIAVQDEIAEETVAIPREKEGTIDIHALLNSEAIPPPILLPPRVDSSPRSSYTSGQSGDVFYDMTEIASAGQSNLAKDDFNTSLTDEENFSYEYDLDDYYEGNDTTVLQTAPVSIHSEQDSQRDTQHSIDLNDTTSKKSNESESSLSEQSSIHSDSNQSDSTEFSYQPSDRLQNVESTDAAIAEDEGTFVYAPAPRPTRRDSMELAKSSTTSPLDPELQEAPVIIGEKSILESPAHSTESNEEDFAKPIKLTVINNDEDLLEPHEFPIVDNSQALLAPRDHDTHLDVSYPESDLNLKLSENYESHISEGHSQHSSLSRNKLFQDSSSSDENGSDHSNINFVARSPIRKMYVINNADPPDIFAHQSEATDLEPLFDNDHHTEQESHLSTGKRDDQEKNDYASAYDRRDASFVAPLLHVNEPTAVGSKTLNRRPPPGISTARKTRGVSNPPPPDIYDTHIQSITPVDPSLKRQASNEYIKEVHEGEGVPSAYVLALRERAGISVSKVPASKWKLPLAIQPHKSNPAKTKPNSKASTVSRRFLSNSDIKHGGSLKPRLLASEIDDTDMVILPKEPAYTPGKELRKLQTLQDPSEDQLGDLVDFGSEPTLHRNTSVTSASTVQPGTDMHPMRLFIANPDGEDSS